MLAAVIVGAALTGCGKDGAGSAAKTRKNSTTTTASSTTAATSTTADAMASTSGPTTAAPTTTAPTTTAAPVTTTAPAPVRLRVGAEAAADAGWPMLAGKNVGVIVNQTSMVDGKHLIDVLKAAPSVHLVAAFSPEHGIRGTGDAGEAQGNSTDPATGVPVYSLYGDTKAPTDAMLDGIDTLVFDLQDVGTRYYTYTATMGLAMQAAAAHGIAFVVLDRPNPLGGENPSGFVRDGDHASFIGKYPTPATHAMTAGELAKAIVGEGWLSGLGNLDLTVVPMTGWSRTQRWADTKRTWVPPSPGLQTDEAATLYPALIWFEATNVSHGKGTMTPFTLIGAPWMDGPSLAEQINAQQLPGLSAEAAPFTPTPIEGMADDPEYSGQNLSGVRLHVTDPATFDPVPAGVLLFEVVQAHAKAAGAGSIITDSETFDLLAGTSRLRQALVANTPAADIVASWSGEVAAFNAVRAKYLLY